MSADSFSRSSPTQMEGSSAADAILKLWAAGIEPGVEVRDVSLETAIAAVNSMVARANRVGGQQAALLVEADRVDRDVGPAGEVLDPPAPGNLPARHARGF